MYIVHIMYIPHQQHKREAQHNVQVAENINTICCTLCKHYVCVQLL